MDTYIFVRIEDTIAILPKDDFDIVAGIALIMNQLCIVVMTAARMMILVVVVVVNKEEDSDITKER